MKKQEYPSKVGNFDIYILSGSKFNAYDRKTVPWIDKLILFIQEIAAHKNNIKVLGVCFGHQILAEAFGFYKMFILQLNLVNRWQS